jgi:NADH:ubiquinone oxidoreductase subunit H
MTLLDFFYTYLPSNSIPLYDLPSRLILSVQSALVCLSDLFSHSGTINYAPTNTLNFSVKLLMCLAFLILIRGGVPRYRYDFLTKLG